jgi:hypothetical protein
LEKIRSKRRALGELKELTVDGIIYPVRRDSPTDRVIAETQALHRISEEVYQDVITHDPSQGKAAKRLAGLFDEYEILTGHYTDLLEHFPTLARDIQALLPSLHDIQVGDSYKN